MGVLDPTADSFSGNEDEELRRRLSVPYVVMMEAVEKANGSWVRRAACPELPGCVVEAATPLEAVERLEELRVRGIRELHESGREVPEPRPPLRTHPVSGAARPR